MKLTRRATFGAVAAAGFAAGLHPAAAAVPEMGDDGLYKPDWVEDTFKDLQEDFADAKAQGRRLMLLVEQRGCIYCKKMQLEVFPDPRIEPLLREKFFVVQINLHGDTEIVDTDGKVLTEKAATRRWRTLFTPTMIFLPTELDTTLDAASQAVAIMPGAFGPGTTLDMLTWILEERYLDQSEEDFQRYHARMIRERNDGSTE